MGGFERSQLVEFERWKKTVDFQSSPRPCGGCARGGGGGGANRKVAIERLCLSLPYVEKPFKSKVIKSFISELRSRQVFFVFRDSYVIYVRYGHYERFAYRYEYVYFTHLCMAM